MSGETHAPDGLVSRSGVLFRPQLLLLAPLLATLVIFVPNLRVVRDVCATPDSFGDIAVAMMASCLVVSVALMASLRKAACTLSGRVALAAAVLYMAAHVALWAIGIAYPDVAPIALWLIGAAMGLALVPLLILWWECYALDFRTVMFYGALSCAESVLIASLISLLPPVGAAVVWCACVAVGAFAPVVLAGAGRAGVRLGEDEGERVAHAVPGGTPAPGADGGSGREGSAFLASLVDLVSSIWLPLVGLLVCMSSSCGTEMSMGGENVRAEFWGLVGAAAVAVALCCVRTKTPLALLVDKVAVPALVVGAFVLQSLAGDGVFEALDVQLAFVPLMFVSLYAMVSLTAIQGFSRLFVAGTVLSLCCLVMLVGSALRWALATDVELVAHVVMSLYYAAVLLHLLYTSWRQLVGRGEDGGAKTTSPLENEAVEVARRQRLDDLAGRCGLTGREREVTEYLSRGYGSPSIAKALSISGNTVRTHMRNIYRKLGVSSHEELLLLFNEVR